MKMPTGTNTGLSGRIRPVLLGIAILLLGLLSQKWWWQLGVLVLIIVFVEALFKYTTLD